MVMVQRQQALSMRRQSSGPGTMGNPQGIDNSRRASQSSRSGSFMSCAMGDEDDGSLSSVSSHKSSSLGSLAASVNDNLRRSSVLSSTFVGGNATTRTSENFYHQKHVKTPRWMLGLLCTLTAFSWVRAVQYRTTTFEILSAMEAELEGFEFQKQQSAKLLKDSTNTKTSFSREVSKLKKTQRLFQHEKRMLEEMAELEASREGENVTIPQKVLDKFQKRRSGDVAKKWIEHRQEAILHKIYNLQAYVQEGSRKRVIEKYGPGPHHVVFDVKSREGRKPGKFTIRMAPLSVAPHSIETFLDMVTNKIWDNTILYWHHSQSHVVAAAPITYGTFQSKEHELNSLGFTGVSFPEYSQDFPHKKYTIGFAGTSQNFYINTVDNEDHHGPGGDQQHHELEGDGDPCFGELINGFDVLADMQYGRHRGETPKGWQDYDLTRVLNARLQPWP